MTGVYDFTFALYDSTASGTQIGNTFTNGAVGVTNGLFNVSLDFGASPFNGQARWLEISVRSNTNSPYTLLAPRQPITATPYALSASVLTTPLSSDLLPSNVSRLNAVQVFTGSNIFAGPAILTNSGNSFAGAFSGEPAASPI